MFLIHVGWPWIIWPTGLPSWMTSSGQPRLFESTNSQRKTRENMCNSAVSTVPMMTSINGSIFRGTGSLCGEFTSHRWIPRTKASDAELWYFLWFAHWINGWVNNREAGDLRRHSVHYDVIVMGTGTSAGTVVTNVRSRTHTGPALKRLNTWAPSQYKDRLIYVWRFPC